MGVSVSRVSGYNRTMTSLDVAKKYFADTENIIIATGKDFPDALSGGALAAKWNAPVLLCDTDSVNGEIIQWIKDNNIVNVYVLGGINAVNESVIKQLESVIN